MITLIVQEKTIECALESEVARYDICGIEREDNCIRLIVILYVNQSLSILGRLMLYLLKQFIKKY